MNLLKDLTLKDLIHQLDIDEAEQKRLKKNISSYINQKHIRKLIKKGLFKRKYIYHQIDNKHLHLTPTYAFNGYYRRCYELEIQENNKVIAVIKISPLLISYRLLVKVEYFNREEITHDQIMTCLKTIIGL